MSIVLLVMSLAQMGHFLYAAKAFDVLERLDPDPEYWEGKRGACVGVFQQVWFSSREPYNHSLVRKVSTVQKNEARRTFTSKLITSQPSYIHTSKTEC